MKSSEDFHIFCGKKMGEKISEKHFSHKNQRNVKIEIGGTKGGKKFFI